MTYVDDPNRLVAQWFDDYWKTDAGDKLVFRLGVIRMPTGDDPYPSWCWWIEDVISGPYPNRGECRRIAIIRLRTVDANIRGGNSLMRRPNEKEGRKIFRTSLTLQSYLGPRRIHDIKVTRRAKLKPKFEERRLPNGDIWLAIIPH